MNDISYSLLLSFVNNEFLLQLNILSKYLLLHYLLKSVHLSLQYSLNLLVAFVCLSNLLLIQLLFLLILFLLLVICSHLRFSARVAKLPFREQLFCLQWVSIQMSQFSKLLSVQTQINFELFCFIWLKRIHFL